MITIPVPWMFVLAMLCLTGAIGVGVYARMTSDPGYKLNAKRTATGFLAATMFFMLFASLTAVGTRRIGVVTSFGRPTGTLSNGLNPKLPWQKVPELDASIQTDSHVGNADGDADRCTDIRIGNESTACVDNTIRWRIVEAEGDQLYRDYRGMDNIRESLVTRELNAALNQVLGGYNPLNAVQNDNADARPNLEQFAREATEIMRKRVDGKIEVLSITIPLIRYDPDTQNKLNAYQGEVANTRIAEQREQTALKQALANKAISESVSNDPNVLVSRCIDILAEMVKAVQAVPAGFNCWPGNQTPIVVPATSGK